MSYKHSYDIKKQDRTTLKITKFFLNSAKFVLQMQKFATFFNKKYATSVVFF